MSFVLPITKCELGITITQQGLINSMGLVGVLLSSHFWGLITDIWGRRRTLLLALQIQILFSIASSLAITSWHLLIGRLIVGIW